MRLARTERGGTVSGRGALKPGQGVTWMLCRGCGGRGHGRETRGGADPIQAGDNGGWTRGGHGGQRAAAGSGLVLLMAGV